MIAVLPRFANKLRLFSFLFANLNFKSRFRLDIQNKMDAKIDEGQPGAPQTKVW